MQRPRGHGRARPVPPVAAAGAVPHARRNRRWWPSAAAAALRRPRRLRGLRARLAVLSRARPADPVARHVRQGQRALDRRQATTTSACPLLDEARSLATARAGGIAWESPFRFDRPAPPWVSSMSPGTALQAYSRAAVRLAPVGRTSRSRARRSASFDPGAGRRASPVRAHFLIYSGWPQLRVLNSFVQSLNGLLRLRALTNDEKGRALFGSGDLAGRARRSRRTTPARGRCTRRSITRESELAYHVLVRGFLVRAAAGLAARRSAYCTRAQHFTRYVREPPAVVLQRSPRPRVRRRAR